MKQRRRRTARRRPPVIVHAALSFDGRVLNLPTGDVPGDTDGETPPLHRRTLAELLVLLARHFGAKRFACAGGSAAARALLAAGLVDEIHLTLRPQIVGGGDAHFPTLTGGGPGAGLDAFFPVSQEYRLLSVRVVAERCHLRYQRTNAKLPKVAANTGSRSAVLALSP